MVARLDGEERARRALRRRRSRTTCATPITALRLLADAVDDGVVDPDTAREYAARMSTTCARSAPSSHDLFELTRL